MYAKKLKMVILLVLTVSSISCTRVIPVRLELPSKPIYNDGISKNIMPLKDAHGKLIGYTVSIDALSNLAENKVMCREYSDTLRQIIKTTH